MNGIDISDWQAGMDITRLDTAEFVIIKATQGRWYVNRREFHGKDADWREWAEQTLGSGKLLGLYHYAEGGDVYAEADFFLEEVKDYIGKALIVLDWEEGDNQSWPSQNNWTYPWLQYVREKTGATPVLYVQQSAADVNDTVFPLMVAQYMYADMGRKIFHIPSNEGEYECAIRQYASDGYVPGWAGDLDMDKAYISKDQWLAWAGADISETEVPMTAIFWNDGTGYYLDCGNWVQLRDENQLNVIRAAYKCAKGSSIPEINCDGNWIKTLGSLYSK